MSKLKITKEQFEEVYKDLPVEYKLFEQYPENNKELIQCLASKLWRLNNLYVIVDKQGMRIPFVMNYAQHIVYAASLIHPRIIILKSRQQGISTFWLISFLDDVLFKEDMSCGLMAQGKAEASTLLRRVGIAWDDFSEELKQLFKLKKIKDNTEELGWNTGSTLFIRTSFRSATLQRLHISEYGKIASVYPERAREVRTGTLQAIRAGNTVVIESTAEGENDFKTRWDKAIEAEQRGNSVGFSDKEFKPVFLSWVNDPDCVSNYPRAASTEHNKYFANLEAELGITLTNEQRWFWLDQYHELGEDIFQEYPATPEEAFTKTNEGSFYNKDFLTHVVRQNRLIRDLYDPNLPVHVALDLGISHTDYFVLAYFQRWNDEWRVIQEYHNSGEGLAHYVEHMRNTGYNIGTVVAPHDIKVRELSTGQSRYHRMLELGVTNIRVLKAVPIADGIEAFRRVIRHLYIDPDRCPYLIKCIKNYSKEWDEKHQTWKRTPIHNEWSHGADTLRGMAVSNIGPDNSLLIPKASGSSNIIDGIAF